jgi:hypothetical protein
MYAKALAGAAVPRTRKTEDSNTMPFQAAYSGEPAERTRERIHARLCRLSLGTGTLPRRWLSDAHLYPRWGAEGSEQPAGAVLCDAVHVWAGQANFQILPSRSRPWRMVGLVWPAQRGNGPVDPQRRSGQGTVDLAEAYQHCICYQKAWLERGRGR